MDTKLTLSMDKALIEEAKKYARERNTSLSNLIENYLTSVTSVARPQVNDITPLVKSLSGVLKLGKKEDRRKEYTEYLIDKYK